MTAMPHTRANKNSPTVCGGDGCSWLLPRSWRRSFVRPRLTTNPLAARFVEGVRVVSAVDRGGGGVGRGAPVDACSSQSYQAAVSP
jgi:hypothetical protein